MLYVAVMGDKEIRVYRINNNSLALTNVSSPFIFPRVLICLLHFVLPYSVSLFLILWSFIHQCFLLLSHVRHEYAACLFTTTKFD